MGWVETLTLGFVQLDDHLNNNQFRMYQSFFEKVHIAKNVVIIEFNEFAILIKQVRIDEDDESVKSTQILTIKREQTFQLSQISRFVNSVRDLSQDQNSIKDFDDVFIRVTVGLGFEQKFPPNS
jgi:hypothetical protein